MWQWVCEGLEREIVVMGMWIFKGTICMDGQDGQGDEKMGMEGGGLEMDVVW